MTSYDTPASITAVLDVPAGRIQVIAADRADTRVDVRPATPGKSRDVEAAEQTTVDFADGVLRVRAPQPFGSSGQLDVTVQLPAGSNVEAKTASVEFRAVGRLGDLAYDSAHGDIKVDEASGARLATRAGHIAVGRLTGPAELSTSKGDITITEAVRGTVVLRTDAGNLTIGAAAGTSATLDARTPHGRIHNALRNAGDTDARLEVHATTSSGDITARSI